MEIVLLSAMGIMLISAVLLLQLGRRHIKLSVIRDVGEEPEQWPRVSVIVPSTGSDPDMGRCLKTLFNQDYPDYDVTVVTRGAEDRATGIAQWCSREYPNTRIVFAGPATTCGQKNHNILAGVESLGDDREVLVFVDSTRIAPPNYLRELVKPIARGQALITSGYHHVIPQAWKVTSLGQAIIVLCLYLTRSVGWMMQPWGSSTAIRRSTFEALHIDKLWRENVVDDVSLAAYLRKVKVGVISTPGAVLTTPGASEGWSGLAEWIARQILYLKFCFPGSWAAGGLYLYLLAGLIATAAMNIVLFPLGMASPLLSLSGAIFLVALGVAGKELRSFHPQPPNVAKWVLGFFAAIIMAAICHASTVFSKEIHWRGISYRVTWTGRVLSIQEAEAGRASH